MAGNTWVRRSSLGLVVALAGCGGGGGSSSPPPAPPSMLAISGTVNGLSGQSVVLRFNSSVDVVLRANGPFTGPLFPRGSAYSLVVQDQPTQPAQTCRVTNGTGTLNAPVNDVVIDCTTNTYRVGGTVTGLAGVRLGLQLNGGTSVPITQDGAFTLPGDLASGTNYAVAVSSQPVGPGQDCVVTNGTGQVTAFDVNVTVTCTTQAFSYVVRDLKARDMAYNPATGELYVSADTGTGPALLVIDPRTGDTLRTVPTTYRASPLAISDDAQFLYANLDTQGKVRRFALPALTTSLEFSLGTHSNGGGFEAADMRVAPGNARALAVTRLNKTSTLPWEYGIAVYDDGVARANTVGGTIPAPGSHPDGVLWSSNGTKLYSFDVIYSSPGCLQESAVSASGVSLSSCMPLPQERSYGSGVIDLNFAYYNFQMAGGRIFTSTGVVYDPALRTQAGAFRTAGQAFAIDLALNKVFFASSGLLLPLKFESFDVARMTPVNSLDVNLAPSVSSGQVLKLVRWGSYGLAAITNRNQLLLASGTFVSEPTGKITLPPGGLVESSGNSGAYQYRVYPLPATDVLWDAPRSRLYAAVNGEHNAFGNSIASIDVSLNMVTAGAAAGSEPEWMAMSDDGTRLYVTNYASSSVQRIDLTTMRLNTTFILNYPGQGPGYGLAAVPVPGDASSFVFTEHYPALSTVFTRMIAGTTLRPLSFDEPVQTLVFSDSDTLFANNAWSSALDFYEIGVVPTGLQQVRNDQGLFNTGRMTFAGGLLYSDHGYSINPATRTLVRAYNPGTGGASKAFRANPARDRGYMAFEDSGSQAQLLVFRLSDGALLATVSLPPSHESPISLTSMDANGVAMTTTAGKTVIVQGPEL